MTENLRGLIKPRKQVFYQILYSNKKKTIIYAIEELSSDSISFSESGIYNWIEQRANHFQQEEISNLYVERIKIIPGAAEFEILRPLDDYLIGTYYGSSLVLTGYEREIYHEKFLSWYEYYKDAVVAGQVLTRIMDMDHPNMRSTITKLEEASNEMYDLVDDYMKFTSGLSTKYITKSILMHPLDAIHVWSMEDDMRQAFKRQLYRMDEGELSLYKKGRRSKNEIFAKNKFECWDM